MANVENYQPKVEDYHSDDSDGGHVLEDSFPRKASPIAQANVSTKRSKDLNSEQAPLLEKMMPANSDVRSDSGYSSFTAASKSSADSAPSATSRSPPVLPTTAPVSSQSPASRPRRPTGTEQRQHSNESSPRQRPISRTASVSSKQRPAPTQRRPTLTQEPRTTMGEECRDPNCTSCGPNVPPQRRRPDIQPSMSTRNVPGYPSEQMSQRPDRSYFSPPSPTYVRQPPPYASQGPTFVQTARTRRSSSTTRPRPQSFAGEPGVGYWGSSMPMSSYPTPPQDNRGPPVSYYNQNIPYGTPAHQYMPPAQQGGYYPPNTQTSPPYDNQRPPLSARNSSYGTRNFPAPIITQESERPRHSARHGPPPTPIEQQMRRAPQPKPKLLQYGDEHEDEGSETESSEEEDDYDDYDERESRRTRDALTARALMPPPKITKRDPSQRRPTLPHAKTTQVVDRLESNRREGRRQSIVIPDRSVPKERERDRASKVTTAPTRRASVSRPPPPHRQTRSQYDTPFERVIVNDSRSNRRRSYQVDEKAYKEFVQDKAFEKLYNAEQKREKRASKVFVQQRPMPGQYDDDDDDEEDEDQDEEPVRILSRPRKNTISDSRKGKERIPEQKSRRTETAASAAEEYIMSTRGSRDPYADQINKAALKRASRMPSLPSDSGSSHSNGSGRASQSNRTTMTSATNNEIRLRVDGTVPLSLQLSGDMEGRTLQLVPAENGMTDLVIGGGNARGVETSYHNERGSVMSSNRRSIVAGQGRRDAEDVSERSSRSGHSRRDRDEIRKGRNDRDGRAPVLQRSRHTTYH